MCGICGIVYSNPDREVLQEDLKKMCSSIIHRGPDEEGFYLNRNAGLGMRRLNVIDLVSGHQPISNEDGDVWIVFNGEIYNYPELRGDLEKRGHRFTTNTDTETIVHAYEEYGDDCVSKLNGMFAFAVWDARKRKLLLARDRLGVKPLYYFWNDQIFVFGSELKALMECNEIPRELDPEALDAFLTVEYIPAPMSIFKGIRKLEAGHTLTLQGGKVSVTRYWNLDAKPLSGDASTLSERLFDLLRDSVRMRLISDVPLGVFLSGGIDSSAIVALMSDLGERRVKTFSIGFDDPSYNEMYYARMVAKHFGTDHHEMVLRPNILDLVDGLVPFLDEPLGDVSIFPTYLVSQLARRDVTVVLSGDGGDELFGGYDWYLAAKFDRYYRRLPAAVRRKWIPWIVGRVAPSSQKKGFVNKVKRFTEGTLLPESLQHFRWNIFLTEGLREELYMPDTRKAIEKGSTESRLIGYLDAVKGSDPLWQQQYADIHTFLVDDILIKVDRMSMANSLEARTPFLDYRVAEFAAGLPENLRIRGLTQKYLLKRAMGKRIPKEILNRKKEGFSIPMKNWLRRELRPLMEEFLSMDRIRKGGLFNPACIERLKKEHLEGTENHSHHLWPLVVFEIWRQRYLN